MLSLISDHMNHFDVVVLGLLDEKQYREASFDGVELSSSNDFHLPGCSPPRTSHTQQIHKTTKSRGLEERGSHHFPTQTVVYKTQKKSQAVPCQILKLGDTISIIILLRKKFHPKILIRGACPVYYTSHPETCTHCREAQEKPLSHESLSISMTHNGQGRSHAVSIKVDCLLGWRQKEPYQVPAGNRINALALSSDVLN